MRGATARRRCPKYFVKGPKPGTSLEVLLSLTFPYSSSKRFSINSRRNHWDVMPFSPSL